MPFKTLKDITEHKHYQKNLLIAFAESEAKPAAFHYFEGFAFEAETGPLLLVGKVESSLIRQIKESGARLTGEGHCARAGKQLRVLNTSTAKGDKLVKALRIARIALEPELVADFHSTPEADAAVMFGQAELDKLARDLKALQPAREAIAGSEFADPDEAQVVAKAGTLVEGLHKAGKADAGEAALAELAKLIRATLVAIARTKEIEEQRKELLASRWQPLNGRTAKLLKSTLVDTRPLLALGKEIQEGYVAKRGDIGDLRGKLDDFTVLLGQLETRQTRESERVELGNRWKPLLKRLSELAKDDHADPALLDDLKKQGKVLNQHMTSVADTDQPGARLDTFEVALTKAEDTLAASYIAESKAFEEESRKQGKALGDKKVVAQKVQAEGRKAKKEESDDEAEEPVGVRPVYAVVGDLPATDIPTTDSAYRKAQGVFNAMSSGDDPNTAAQKAGVSEAPSKIEIDKDRRWAYEFRLSHGQTQYRLNAIATSADKGRNIEVSFAYLGRGH
ncbi:MAG: hypothetical protein ABI699_16725 [Caldimonas sp.]